MIKNSGRKSSSHSRSHMQGGDRSSSSANRKSSSSRSSNRGR
jgi:hypothetical protein